MVLQIFQFILLARVLMSWFPNIDPSNPLVRMIYEITEPVLAPVRTLLRDLMPQAGMVDFSPIVVFLILMVLMRVIIML
jgi:YggT family protein